MLIIFLLSFVLSCTSKSKNKDKSDKKNIETTKQVSTKVSKEDPKPINSNDSQGSNITDAQSLGYAIMDIQDFICNGYRFKKCNIISRVTIKIMDQLFIQIEEGFKHIKPKINDAKIHMFKASIKEIENFIKKKKKGLNNTGFHGLYYMNYNFAYRLIDKYKINLGVKDSRQFKKAYIKSLFLSVDHTVKLPPVIKNKNNILSRPYNGLLENLEDVKKFHATKLNKVINPSIRRCSEIAFFAGLISGWLSAIVIMITSSFLPVSLEALIAVVPVALGCAALFGIGQYVFRKWSNKKNIKKWGKQIKKWDQQNKTKDPSK